MENSQQVMQLKEDVKLEIPKFTLLTDKEPELHRNWYQDYLDKKVLNPESFLYITKIFPNLVDFMRQHNGCGLAVNQFKVGEGCIPDPFFIMDDGERGPELFYMPVITKALGKYVAEEGCLSCEGRVALARPDEVHITYINIYGEQKKQRRKGMSARIIQHECSHLMGKTIHTVGK